MKNCLNIPLNWVFGQIVRAQNYSNKYKSRAIWLTISMVKLLINFQTHKHKHKQKHNKIDLWPILFANLL